MEGIHECFRGDDIDRCFRGMGLIDGMRGE